MLRVYDERLDFPIYNDVFKNKYFVEVMADALGYAGTEIIRRTVGDSKVKELNDVKDLNIKIPMERSLIELGIKLIKNRY
jgi:5-methylthioribose kinase